MDVIVSLVGIIVAPWLVRRNVTYHHRNHAEDLFDTRNWANVAVSDGSHRGKRPNVETYVPKFS